MKTLRILLVLAAALSLGLAVFASVRANIKPATATQPTIRVADDGESWNIATGSVSGQVV